MGGEPSIHPSIDDDLRSPRRRVDETQRACGSSALPPPVDIHISVLARGKKEEDGDDDEERSLRQRNRRL